jgi:hypothetical protein
MSVAVGIAQPRIVSGAPAFRANIDQGGRKHAARRRHAGENAPWPRGELSVQELALDLQADQQEEHRHQDVVDPMQDAQAPDIGLEQAEVGRGKGRVCNHNRSCCCRHEDKAAARLALEKSAKR